MRQFLVTWHRYFEIVWFKTYANLKGEHEKTYLGCLWWMLEPMLNTAVFYFVFAEILKTKTEGFIVFLYVGNVIYGWFSGGLTMGASSIISHSSLMQQVNLPKILFPIIAVSNITWKFLFSLLALFPLLWLNHTPITWTYLALPLLLTLQFIVIVGISLPLAILMPYFPDGRTVLTVVVSMGMWVSGVFYSAKQVSPVIKTIFYLNPIAVLIENFRRVLIDGRWPEWHLLAQATATGVLLWFIGIFLVRRMGGHITKLAL